MSPRQELDFKNNKIMVIAGMVDVLRNFFKYVNAMLSTKVWHPLEYHENGMVFKGERF